VACGLCPTLIVLAQRLPENSRARARQSDAPMGRRYRPGRRPPTAGESGGSGATSATRRGTSRRVSAALEKLLKLHDGIVAFGATPEEVDDASSIDSLDKAILSSSQIIDDLDQLATLAESELVPPGILPFHVPDGDSMTTRTVFAPTAERIVLVAPTPQHRSASELANHKVAAATFADWLEAWVESGFDPYACAIATPSSKAQAIERFAVGDIVTLEGPGYYWVVSVTADAHTQRLDLQQFASEREPGQFAPGATRRAAAAYCARVEPSRRAALLRIIPADILARLPGAS
jgi:hypothetical protein